MPLSEYFAACDKIYAEYSLACNSAYANHSPNLSPLKWKYNNDMLALWRKYKG